MNKKFNTDGYCDPKIHYMVDLSSRLAEIKSMVDDGKYFTINKARQYGKTTLLAALSDFLKKDYEVASLDFQAISYADFATEQSFVAAFSSELLACTEQIPGKVKQKLQSYADSPAQNTTLSVLFRSLSEWCKESEKKIVLVIDEVDSATNNQVFIDFLAQLRAYYLKRRRAFVFQSVILASVYDVRNIRRKIRPEDAHKENSPWNIASDFLVDMSFSKKDIAGMLDEYEKDRHKGMDVHLMAGLLYDYTNGYPYLVSRLCLFMDERMSGQAWTKEGFLASVKMLLEDSNPLFQSLMNKLDDFPELCQVISRLLFQGQGIAYNVDNIAIQDARMFGFVKVENSVVLLANRIFEMRLYNKFLLDFKEQNSEIYSESSRQKINMLLIDALYDDT